MILTGETEVQGEKLSHCIFSITNYTWTGLVPNPGLRGERLVSNRPIVCKDRKDCTQRTFE